MGMMSKRKGKVGEREVAQLLRDHGFDGKRGVQHKGGADSPDVLGLPGFHIEVKRVEQFNLYEALNQAEQDVGERGPGLPVPVVFHRRNGRPWVAVIRADDLLKLIGKEPGE